MAQDTIYPTSATLQLYKKTLVFTIKNVLIGEFLKCNFKFYSFKPYQKLLFHISPNPCIIFRHISVRYGKENPMSNLIPGNHKHLTLKDREYIEKSLNEGKSFKETAKYLCKDPSTISKEVWGTER